MQPIRPTPLRTNRPIATSQTQVSQMYNQPPPEVQQAYLPAETGVLPLIVRAGTPIATYRLNKIETPQANGDQIYFHVEKFCTMDALWYPQWLTLSLYCQLTRDLLLAVVQAALERPERAHFMATFARILALPDRRPQAAGNPLSTRFHWRGPMHETMWQWLQQGESPWDVPFQVYPQPPARPRVDMRFYSRAMLPFVTETPATTTAATSTGTTTTPTTTGSSTEVVIADQMEEADSGNVSDAGSAATHVTFLPPKKRAMKTQPPTSS